MLNLKKEYPAYYIIIAVLLTSAISFYALTKWEDSKRVSLINESNMGYSDANVKGSQAVKQSTATESTASAQASQEQTKSNKAHTLKNKSKEVRANIGGLTRPLLMVESPSPSEELAALGVSLNDIVNSGKRDGKIKSASVYVKDMDNDLWIDVNDSEGYYPGSLMKLAVLICYLKKSESHPEILDKTLILERAAVAPGQSYPDEVIKPGVPYKISDLLYKMIVRSDNFSTLLLNRELDINELNKLFNTLGLKPMDMHNINYTITAKDYSKFMRVLYNSTYLNANNSQFALSMMSHSTFTKGLIRELPQNVIVAHKFGENVSGNIRELHESGIVYTGSKTYIITVMTKGEKVSDLADEISAISKEVYHYFQP